MKLLVGCRMCAAGALSGVLIGGCAWLGGGEKAETVEWERDADPGSKTLANFPGTLSTKSGWKLKMRGAEGEVVYIPFEGYYESKGGRIESKRIRLVGKPEGKGAFYLLRFDLKAKAKGYWWVDLFDADGNMLPDINSAVYPSDDWRHYDEIFVADGRAASVQLAFLSGRGAEVKDVSLVKLTTDEAAAWCDRFYATLPQLASDIPSDPFALLPRTKAALQDGRPLKVVLLGDSIMNDTYCSGFTSLIKRDYPKSDPEFIISVRGSTGTSWYHTAENFAEYVLKHRPDLVVIGGISNGVWAKPYKEAPEDDMVETIERCKDAGIEVVVCTPPPSYEFRRSSEQTHWNESSSWSTWSKMEKRWCYWFPLSQWYHRAATARTGTALWDLSTDPCDTIARSRKPLDWFKRDAAHNDDRGKQLIGRQLARYFAKAKIAPRKPVARPERPAVAAGLVAPGATMTRLDTETADGRVKPVTILVTSGDRVYRLLGTEPRMVPPLAERSCTVKDGVTTVVSEDDRTAATLVFAADGAISATIRQKDGAKRPVKVAVRLSGRLASDDPNTLVTPSVVRDDGRTVLIVGKVTLVAPAGAEATPAFPAPAADTFGELVWSYPAADSTVVKATIK
ncbi:MAG: hypothetical protein J6T01_05205 [Kiritimatiellae bacterium]|nr:hypothetical protein [Kiritimatiellia bacterium]